MSIVTPADVASWADLELDATGTTLMTKVVNAVEAHLEHAYDIPVPAPADVVQAVTMQSSRLYKRRGTPNGIEGFGESYVVRVTKFDGDVQSMLSPFEKFEMA